MRSELSRRGGRPTKPAASGEKKIKLSLVVTPDTKRLLDAAREQGRTQAEEATRLIQLGRLFEAHGRFTLPLELQKRAIEWIASDGNWGAIVNYLMTRDAPDEAELYYRVQGLYSALASFVANHQIRRPEEMSLDTPAVAEAEMEAKESRKAG